MSTDLVKGFIKITGKISKETFDNVSLELGKFENTNVNYIDILLTSPGGRYSYALDIALLFMRSKIEISITAKKHVASAAIFILAAGSTRYADSKETIFRFHTPTEILTNESGTNYITAFSTNKKIYELGECAIELRKLCTKITSQIIDYLIERTGMDRNLILRLLIQSKKINALEAQNLKLIQSISKLSELPSNI